MNNNINSKLPCNINGLQGQLLADVPMAKYTTWRVGGLADWLYKPAHLGDLLQFMERIPQDMPVFYLGLGSNILVRDAGIRGVVILTAGAIQQLKLLAGAKLYVEAGVSCAKVAKIAAKSQLGGAEFLAGIPGTMGGALAMNAGAWGGETWNLVHSVTILKRNGQLYKRTASDFKIGYRQVQGLDSALFVTATLQLNPQPDLEVRDKIKQLLQQRNASQPIGLACAGSVFRNPPGDYAARLIDNLGLKGYSIGGACISAKHANFIINQGNATAQDIEQLIQFVQAKVAENTGINLIPEVHILG
jgi:UDP-N-acetylmuramate dehydrogenase